LDKPKAKKPVKREKIIGWRETVSLPDLGIPAIKAKIDSGARTSALHALKQKVFERDGMEWVSFRVPLPGTPHESRCEAPLADRRKIKNTSGVPEERLIIKTTLKLGNKEWLIEVSLADREKMEFDLILGRTAIRRRGYLIDPRRSYLSSPDTNSAGEKAGKKL
jgi:hypothetical protein